MNIGANIKALRQKKGLTQTQLGELVGVTKQMISVWENCKKELTFETVVKIANALGVDCKELLDTGGSYVTDYKKQVSWERRLLHRQLDLLAEVSNDCTDNMELAALSEQMALIYTALNK